MQTRTSTKRLSVAALVYFSLFTFHFSLFRLTAQQPVFRSATNVVVVPVTVTDRNGRFVPGLTADQFEITDDGARRPITQFSADRAPVSLGILLDISGSMASDPKARAAEDARWADTRRALETLIRRLDPRDEVFFAAFSEKVGLAVPWTQEYQKILPAFDALRPGGKTAIFNAVTLMAPAFQLARHQRKVLLLISDGQDTSAGPARRQYRVPIGGASAVFSSENTARESVIAATRRVIGEAEVSLYAIGIGTRGGAPVDVPTLDRLTVDTGGYVEPLRNPSEIPAAVARVCDELQSQYLLGFEPAKADGNFHPISVKVKDSRLRARARAGYVAK